jgi:hypothetical protein
VARTSWKRRNRMGTHIRLRCYQDGTNYSGLILNVVSQLHKLPECVVQNWGMITTFPLASDKQVEIAPTNTKVSRDR